MLSAVGLGANRLRPAKFAFNFTPPSNAPQMPHGKDEPYQKPAPKPKPALEATEDTTVATAGEHTEVEEKKATDDEPQQPSAPEGPSRKRQRKDNQDGAEKASKDESKSAFKGNQGNKPQKSQPTPKRQKQKLQRLPTNTIVSKRPLLHPAIPSPFASSSSQKVVYVNASAPFVSKVKQVRKLLEEISKRQKQSLTATATGKLNPKAVEQAIADARNAQPAAKESEAVYLKATGKAIPTALNIGLFFQNQSDYNIKIEIGEVSAIDDIKLRKSQGEPVPEDLKEEEAAAEVVELAQQQTEVRPEAEVKQEKGNHKKNQKRKFAEEVPETRIRTLSAVTVAISFK